MLGVKHGQVLISDHLDLRGTDVGGQVRDLRCVQIVRGGMRLRPSERSFAAAIELAAFRLKSPISGGCSRSRTAWRKPAERTKIAQSRLTRKSTMRASPGFNTRGLATRAAIPLDFTRSNDGRSP